MISHERGDYAMKIITFAIALLIMSFGAAAAQPSPLLPLFVEVTSSDPVGEQVAYYLRDDIARSSRYHLVYRKDASGFTVRLVTMDENRNDPGQATVYAVALTFSPTDGYLDVWVGDCGSERTKECAADILAGVSGDIDSLRSKS